MGSRNNKPGRIVKGTALQPTLKDASGIWSLDEAMQAHRANAWPQPDLFQPVSNSLRVKQQNTTSPGVLTKPIVKDGNRRQFTMSMWVKLGTLTAPSGSIRTLFEGFPGTDNTYWLIYISSGNQIAIARDDNGGGSSVQWAGVLRDPAAWYHLVFTTDTQQATDTNRVKLYINGVQQTLSGTFPTQGYATNMGITRDRNNGAITNGFGAGIRIGSRWNLTFDQNFDGGYSEVNFVDGYALSPTLFGKFDTNNTWVPVPYTGTYGTNGFYLPFNNATTSQTLGYDASVNGTTVYDADQDPYRGSVALHLTGNGPAGGQNNTFADSSPNNLAIVRSGSATQGSFSPFPMPANTPYNPSVHGASAYFGTSNTDNVYAASNSVLAIGTNNFTLEFWANWTAWTGNQRFILMGQSGASNLEISRDDGTDVLRIYISSSIITYAWTPTTNAWHHIALVRTGTGSGQVTLYINGVSVATGTSSTSISANNFFVGGLNWAADYNMRGHISNVRLINGAAVYTSNFTPTNRPFGTLTNNLLPFSEDIANATWTAQSQGVSFTTNAAIAPDGTPSATLIVPSTASATQNIAGLHDSSAGVNTFSIFAKSAGYRYIQCLHSRSAGGDAGYVTFDLATGTVTNSSVWSGSIVNVGNGWYRLIATTSSLSGASANSNVRWAITDGSASRGVAFTGNGTSGVYVWGAQAELASSAGNYTPTPANFRTAPALLLNFANAAIVDSAGANNTLTGGNATISSASKYGSGAMSFTSDGYLSFAPGSQYAFGTGDFTIEAWVRTTETTGDGFYRRIYMTDGPTGNASGNIQLAIAPSTGYANLWDGGGLDMLSTTNISTGAWFHIAATRVGTTLRLFVNGRQEAISSYNTSIAPNSGNPRPWVGAYTSSSGRWNGQIDDLRVTRGVARYQDNFTPPERALPETGGKSFVTTNVNAGVVQRFTTVGTTSWTAPTDVTQVEVLVVAGGASGGNFHGGGGGAGGLIYNNQYPVTPGQTYTVTVGAGGTGVTITRGINGGNSQFGNLVAIGGGGGGNEQVSLSGVSGGSGGGTSYGTGVSGGAGTPGQGFAGGAASSSAAAYAAAGGGGAGGVGGNPPNTNQGGAGGAGLQFGISGIPAFYAAGGGGSVYNASGIGIGGSGIGGNGASFTSNIAATSGATNTGSGGGGGERASGANVSGAGGAGVVIVRYTTTAVGNTSDATTDNLVDSPTQYGHDYGNGGEVVGNYCTLNPIDTETDHSFSNGNLTLFKASSNWSSVRSTMAFSSGKWYFETTYNASWDYAHVGVLDVTVDTYAGQVANSGYVGSYAKGWAWQQDLRTWNNNATGPVTGVRCNVGDIAMCAVDMDNGKIWWGRNGVWFSSGDPATGANAAFSNLSGTVSPAFSVYGNSSGITVNFGQRAWAYAPPAGFNAITTKNLPRPAVGSAVANPNQYFDAVTYTGNGTTQTISSLNFQPDFVWLKIRSSADSNGLFDSVRGAGKRLQSNDTGTESNRTDVLTSFTSSGFSITGSDTQSNANGSTYAAWCWRAGGAAVSNTDGTITSSVSANTASGFSIVTYTGNGTAGASIGHGLGKAPSVIFPKVRSRSGDNWHCYHSALGGTQGILLNATNAASTDAGFWNNTNPTSSVITLGSYNTFSGQTYVAYCWAEVEGFSKFGSYTGNGSADGPFIYTGFKPRFVMVKCSSSGSTRWIIWDTARDPVNFATRALSPNLSSEEITAFDADILSNGFKLRDAEGTLNGSGATYIYMAFAEKPFGNINGLAR